VHKLAVFVEGTSELLFMNAVIEAVAGAHNVLIEQMRIRGGSKAPRSMSQIQALRPNTGQRYYVLLVDCGGDDLVKDRILEEHESLTRNNYTKIIGIRDVRPKFAHADIPRLEAGLKKYVRTSLIPVQFVLQVMEIEAWFLAEFNHFPKIHPAITSAAIQAALGFDPESDDMALRVEPSDDLSACYRLGGKTYTKPSVPTITALDLNYIYLDLQNRIPYLRILFNSLDAFLA